MTKQGAIDAWYICATQFESSQPSVAGMAQQVRPEGTEAGRCLSPEGTQVNSQGRKPLDEEPNNPQAPKGRHTGSVAPPGLPRRMPPGSRGLRPWLLTVAALRLTRWAPSPFG